MAFVYRYSHPMSGATFYIGKTSGDDLSSLAARISAHANEEKFKKNKPRRGYVIEYIGGLSAADADILETALINAYANAPKLNRQKTGWGQSGFVNTDGLAWKSWPPETESRVRPLLEWNVPGSEDALYTCHHCGKKQVVGKSCSPRYAALNLHSAHGSCIVSVWLCDACSDEVCGALMAFMDRIINPNPKEA